MQKLDDLKSPLTTTKKPEEYPNPLANTFTPRLLKNQDDNESFIPSTSGMTGKANPKSAAVSKTRSDSANTSDTENYNATGVDEGEHENRCGYAISALGYGFRVQKSVISQDSTSKADPGPYNRREDQHPLDNGGQAQSSFQNHQNCNQSRGV